MRISGADTEQGESALETARFINWEASQQLCDYVFDEREDNSDLPDSGLVWCRTHHVEKLFDEISSRPGPYTLVTHKSDHSISSFLVKRIPRNVRKWFGTNVGTRHPLVEAIPIGIGATEKGQLLANQRSTAKRTNTLLYVCHAINSEPVERNRVRDEFAGRSWAKVECYDHWDLQGPLATYLENVHASAYVASPRGKGVDCYRTWEALYLGAIPICKRSVEMSFFEQLPILFVDDWGEATQSHLEDSLERLQPKWANANMLMMDYWAQRIRAHQTAGD